MDRYTIRDQTVEDGQFSSRAVHLYQFVADRCSLTLSKASNSNEATSSHHVQDWTAMTLSTVTPPIVLFLFIVLMMLIQGVQRERMDDRDEMREGGNTQYTEEWSDCGSEHSYQDQASEIDSEVGCDESEVGLGRPNMAERETELGSDEEEEEGEHGNVVIRKRVVPRPVITPALRERLDKHEREHMKVLYNIINRHEKNALTHVFETDEQLQNVVNWDKEDPKASYHLVLDNAGPYRKIRSGTYKKANERAVWKRAGRTKFDRTGQSMGFKVVLEGKGSGSKSARQPQATSSEVRDPAS
ncbi:MAG: hypothetical protein Q9222_000084 [Ikaeria aurantiellina]